MSDERTETAADTIPDAPKPATVSRRDFLRRTGKKAAQDAAEIGTRIVPGGALVKAFLDGGRPDTPETPPADTDAAGTDTPALPAPPPVKPSLNPLDWLAGWRSDRGAKP